jgi:hypothetical protein
VAIGVVDLLLMLKYARFWPGPHSVATGWRCAVINRLE